MAQKGYQCSDRDIFNHAMFFFSFKFEILPKVPSVVMCHRLTLKRSKAINNFLKPSPYEE